MGIQSTSTLHSSKVIPDRTNTGPHGQGTLHLAVVAKDDPSDVLCVTPVHNEDFDSAIAQNILHMDTVSTSKQREHDESSPEDTFGIVFDSRAWYFHNYSLSCGSPSLCAVRANIITINYLADNSVWQENASQARPLASLRGELALTRSRNWVEPARDASPNQL